MKKKIIIIASVIVVAILGLFIFMKKDKVLFLSYTDAIFDGDYMEYFWESVNNANIKSDFMDEYMLTFGERVNYSREKKYATILVMAESEAKYETEMLADYYDDTTFINFDVSYETKLDNLVGVNFDVYNASYIAGYIAAKKTETNNLGFIGGVENDYTNEYYEGFISGAKKANSKVKITKKYVGSESDEATAKTLADEMYNSGVDVILQVAGASGKGVINSAIENDKFVIGSGYDQTPLAPNNMLTSITKNIKEALNVVLKDYKKDKLQNNYNFSFEDDMIDLAESNLLDEELINEINELKITLTQKNSEISE